MHTVFEILNTWQSLWIILAMSFFLACPLLVYFEAWHRQCATSVRTQSVSQSVIATWMGVCLQQVI